MASAPTSVEKNLVLKRRRGSDDMEHVNWDETRQYKRPNVTRLPIRTSPVMLQNNLWHDSFSINHRPLTPVDSSDDEARGQADSAWSRRRLAAPQAQRFSDQKIPLVTVEMEMEDDVMDASTTHVSKAKEKFSSPHRRINLLSAPAISLDERVPTPITANFNPYDASPKNRGRQSNRHTALSPVLLEEPYLPSPIEPDELFMEDNPETIMRMEHTSSGFGALSVACEDDDIMEDIIQSQDITRSTKARGTRWAGARNAKLHMGYRADCEKCQAKVPGHYSHIIWN